MKVRRVLEIEGPKEWVNDTLERSYVQPDRPVLFQSIRAEIRELPREVIEE